MPFFLLLGCRIYYAYAKLFDGRAATKDWQLFEHKRICQAPKPSYIVRMDFTPKLRNIYLIFNKPIQVSYALVNDWERARFRTLSISISGDRQARAWKNWNKINNLPCNCFFIGLACSSLETERNLRNQTTKFVGHTLRIRNSHTVGATQHSEISFFFSVFFGHFFEALLLLWCVNFK